MKTIFKNNVKIVMYVILGILLIISSYLLILNIHHYQSLSSEVIVSEIDNDYAKYKENVNSIEKIISNYQSEDEEHLLLDKLVDIMKREGVYRLIPKTKLTYHDLYILNDYFMEELINNGWVSNIIKLDVSSKYQNIIMMLVNNANYLNAVFTNNGLTLYDGNLDNKIEDNYHFILSNYMMYSNVILDICNELGGIHE